MLNQQKQINYNSAEEFFRENVASQSHVNFMKYLLDVLFSHRVYPEDNITFFFGPISNNYYAVLVPEILSNSVISVEIVLSEGDCFLELRRDFYEFFLNEVLAFTLSLATLDFSEYDRSVNPIYVGLVKDVKNLTVIQKLMIYNPLIEPLERAVGE